MNASIKSNWLNYHHLIYFREIARLGSLARASETLQVGQPALSAQLKKFESDLGVELFHRRNRRLILTDAGTVALEYANKIGELGQEFLQVIQDRSTLKRQRLNVGAVDAIPKHLVSEIIDITLKQTGCFLSIIEGSPDYLIRELEAHQIDVIISDQALAGSSSDRLYSSPILKSTVKAYGTDQFTQIRKQFPTGLNRKPGIFPTDHSKLRTDLDHYFRLKKIYMDQVAETQDSMLQKILAVKGDGIIFLPELAAAELVEEKKLCELGTLQGVTVEYFLCYAKRVIENPALELLLKQSYHHLTRQKNR